MDRRAWNTRLDWRWYIVAALIVGAALGLILGLLFGWVWLPVRWTDAGPADLRSDHRNEYLLTVAERYARDGDLEEAHARLGVAPGDETQMAEMLERLALELEGQPSDDVQALATDLKGGPPGTAVALQTPRTRTAPTISPTPCGPWFTCVSYVVQPGDTLFSLAEKAGMTVDQLRRANCLEDDAIRADQELCLPFIPTPTPTSTPIPTFTPPPTWTPVPTWTPRPVPGPTQRPGSTSTPPREPFAAEPSLVDTLSATSERVLTELYYVGRGAGGSLLACEDPSKESPSVYQFRLWCLNLTDTLFHQEDITVELRSPTGESYVGTFRIERREVDGKMKQVVVRVQPPMTDDESEAGYISVSGNDEFSSQESTSIALPLWPAANLPPGRWHVMARWAGKEMQSWTEVHIKDLQSISVVPSTGTNPLEGERTDPATYLTGELVEIHGVGYAPNTERLLQVYSEPSEPHTGRLERVYTKLVTTDDYGRFQTPLRIGEDARTGMHIIVYGEPECGRFTLKFCDLVEAGGHFFVQ